VRPDRGGRSPGGPAHRHRRHHRHEDRPGEAGTGPRHLWRGPGGHGPGDRQGGAIVLNGQINAAREATKTHTSDVETFKSGDFGFLGVTDNDRVVFFRAPARRQQLPLRLKEGEKLPYVEIVAMYGGADGAMIRAAVAGGAKGIVVQALGWGNVNIPMYEAIQQAVARGVAVVISTRVPNGRVLPNYGFKGGGKTLQEAGAVFADNLSPQKARILLMLALQSPTKGGELQKLFDR
jgi:L-asparaginase